MGSPYVGEIRMFGGNFAPNGWLFCDGSLLPISENEVLFMLIGTTYGGDGESTFALPDLRGRIPVHQGNGFVMGEMAGVEQVTLTTTQIPAHGHPLLASTSAGSDNNTSGKLLAQSPTVSAYVEASTDGNLAANAISSVGGSQPHDNIQPILCINFIISLYGIFPSPT